jgi:hypothetical protein
MVTRLGEVLMLNTENYGVMTSPDLRAYVKLGLEFSAWAGQTPEERVKVNEEREKGFKRVNNEVRNVERWKFMSTNILGNLVIGGEDINSRLGEAAPLLVSARKVVPELWKGTGKDWYEERGVDIVAKAIEDTRKMREFIFK